MSTTVLILIVWTTLAAPAVTTQEFDTSERCTNAGQAMVEATRGTLVKIVWGCLRK